jgi:hypothetical protein
MKYTVDNGIKFAKLSGKQYGELLALEIGDMFIRKAQVVEVRHTLELMDKSHEELQAIRNSIVRYFGAMSSQARELGDVELFNQVHNTMSGVTAVIDQMFYC